LENPMHTRNFQVCFLSEIKDKNRNIQNSIYKNMLRQVVQINIVFHWF